MNILHVKYAVEISKTKSISKAAEALYTTQPNLSRAIKELEETLGIIIFKRTPSGIITTEEGEEFLQYGRSIISQLEEVEQKYINDRERRQRLSVYVPRSTYISYALVAFAQRLDLSCPAEIFYKETNAAETISAVAKEDCNLGIVRYQENFDRYYKDLFNKKEFNIFLTHAPQAFIRLSKKKGSCIVPNTDMAVSGHMHNGLLPNFLGKYMHNRGIISPQMQLFPDYAQGKYQQNDTTYVINGPVNAMVGLPIVNDIYGPNATVVTLVKKR